MWRQRCNCFATTLWQFQTAPRVGLLKGQFRAHKWLKIMMLWHSAGSPKPRLSRKSCRCLGGHVVFRPPWEVFGRGLLVLSDGLPMLGVLHTMACQAVAP